MKQILVLFMVFSLTLGAIACAGSSDVQNESGSTIEGSSTLSRVALEVPTIF